jgi:hypothetical protein
MLKLTTLALLACAIVSQANNTTGLAYLKISPDAASAGAAELALPAGAGPLQAIFQPALETGAPESRFAVSRANWIFDSEVNVLAWSAPLGSWTIGADLRMWSADNFEERVEPDPEPIGTFSADGLAYGLRLAAPIGGGWRAGAALRRVHEKISTYDTRGWSVDLATIWRGSTMRLPVFGEGSTPRLGLALRNLGSVSKYVSEAPNLPQTISVSSGVNRQLPGLEGWSLDTGVEIRHLKHDRLHGHFGLELAAGSRLRVRAGWMSGYDDRGLTAGFGLVWRGMALDYAWLPFDSGLDDIHRFSFTFGFLGGL